MYKYKILNDTIIYTLYTLLIINFIFNNSVTKLVESNELLSKDLLDFIESYKVRHSRKHVSN